MVGAVATAVEFLSCFTFSFVIAAQDAKEVQDLHLKRNRRVSNSAPCRQKAIDLRFPIFAQNDAFRKLLGRVIRCDGRNAVLIFPLGRHAKSPNCCKVLPGCVLCLRDQMAEGTNL